MDAGDLKLIEEALEIRLPRSYTDAILSETTVGCPEVFDDADVIIATNKALRKQSWLGRPLENAFFVFGRDHESRELFLDMDFPNPPILKADYNNKAGVVLSFSFVDWLSKTKCG
jgi:hypothetical protein